MTTLDETLAGAIRLAKSAALKRAGLDACPYPPGSRGNRKAARLAWLREYRRLRPDEVTEPVFADDLTALAHGPDDRALGSGPVPAPDMLIPHPDGR